MCNESGPRSDLPGGETAKVTINEHVIKVSIITTIYDINSYSDKNL